ncbi:hypothetical protein AVEN_27447-1 [Araneus ventricosus]|uniref:Transposable element Tc3 transposase n=1 Tax=Araneus ventricosus TaxID=182803 RepID=A0A4Y2EG00_ARAVE|nr:hypothetical protein AVEN_27447-1 [Araneus ventricosus]
MSCGNGGFSKSRIWTIFNESGAHPYRSTPVQGLLPRDVQERYTGCNFVMNNLEDHPKFLAGIILTNEPCFSRNGTFNRQIVHTCSLENPRYAVEVDIIYAGRLMFGEKFLMARSLGGSVFYEGTLTGQKCLELLQDVITDFVENLLMDQLRNVWFQHDGSPPHKISNVKQYLMETFQNQVLLKRFRRLKAFYWKKVTARF